MKKQEQVGVGAERTNEELLGEGTDESMRELWCRIEPRVRATVRRIAATSRLADYVDDLFGETQVRYLRLRGQTVTNVYLVLATVIRHLALDEIARRARKPTAPLEGCSTPLEDQSGEGSFGRTHQGNGNAGSTGLETEITFWDSFEHYRERQPRRARIFGEYYVDGRTTRELADEYDTTVEAIQRDLSRARKDLRDIFNPGRRTGALGPATAGLSS